MHTKRISLVYEKTTVLKRVNLIEFHPMYRRYRQRQGHCQHQAGFVAEVIYRNRMNLYIDSFYTIA